MSRFVTVDRCYMKHICIYLVILIVKSLTYFKLQFHPTYFNECNNLPMLRLQSIHVRKQGSWISNVLFPLAMVLLSQSHLLRVYFASWLQAHDSYLFLFLFDSNYPTGCPCHPNYNLVCFLFATKIKLIGLRFSFAGLCVTWSQL